MVPYTPSSFIQLHYTEWPPRICFNNFFSFSPSLLCTGSPFISLTDLRLISEDFRAPAGGAPWRIFNGNSIPVPPDSLTCDCGAGSTGQGATGLGAPGPLAPAGRTGSPGAAAPRGLTRMRSRSSRGRASRTLKPPSLPLTGVGARHSDPSRLSAGPFPGRLPDPAHGPSRGTAAPRTVLVPCAGVPSQHTRVFSGATRGPEDFLTRAASAPERVSNFRGGGTSVAAPSRGFTGPAGWLSGTGSSGPGRVIGPDMRCP